MAKSSWGPKSKRKRRRQNRKEEEEEEDDDGQKQKTTERKEKKRKKERKKNPREENAYTHFDASKSVGIARSLARSCDCDCAPARPSPADRSVASSRIDRYIVEAELKNQFVEFPVELA